MRRLHAIVLAALLIHSGGTASAQSDPRIVTLGQLLEAEDRRAYQPTLFQSAIQSADPIIRRQAMLVAGRIQDRRAGPLLLAQLQSPDTSRHAAAMFALGLLADSSLTRAIIARLSDDRPLADGAVIEAPSTLAKLGAAEARTLFSRLLDGTSRAVSATRFWLMRPGLLLEGWRFGRHAPVQAALAHLHDSSAAVRWRAAYLLGRTRAAVGVRSLLAASTDAQPWVRQNALRGLTRIAVDSAGVPRDSVVPALLRGLTDLDAGVRINALISLATWGDSALASPVVASLRDPIPNVRFQAVTALVALRGSVALASLGALADSPREPLVIRREALLGLLRTDTAVVLAQAERLAISANPRERGLSLELATAARTRNTGPFAPLLEDADPAIRAQAMANLGALDPALDADIFAAAHLLRSDSSAQLRSAAWGQLARRADSPAAISELVAGLGQEIARGRRGAPGPILNALRRLHTAGGAGREAVERLFLATTTPPQDYLLRRSASNWPALAARWGPVYPAEVRYSAREYQELAARWLLDSTTARPRVWVETSGRGRVEIELLGDHAPLTVANFLGLVDQGAFDGGEWHRVIPNFVVQDGAGPRARPIGGLAPIRDEFNPVRYDAPVLGMALSGPDTGTSQWFINLSPQPHLDGGYTVFGRVIGSGLALEAILQGDAIQSITRR